MGDTPQHHDLVYLVTIAALVFAAVYLFAHFGWTTFITYLRNQEVRYDRTLNQDLLLGVHPKAAIVLHFLAMFVTGLILYYMLNDVIFFIVGCVVGFFISPILLKHMETKRRLKLESQLVDGITTIASGVRAGLTLIQSMEVLVKNSQKPIKQEFEQLLREYQMGLDLNQCMRNAANRIGSQHYRLLFTAIEMHRLRGGDAGESLDRIAESIREIQRLEGKLDAITAQGRSQARMMAVMPIILLGVLYFIMPRDVALLFNDPIGRLMLLVGAVLTAIGFLWIRKIMSIDI